MALALSGGGDSMALLHLAADWARARQRPLLALTVDHGLNRDSARWTEQAAAAARAAGTDWRGLKWDGDKPVTGLTAAARAARHRLIAEAARGAGARVILMAHTADDVAEADWMRAEGATLGRVREWSPSPVWPEGRGLMLLRPLLDERRATLRRWLSARGLNWIEDPANVDPRFGRSRARQALAALALAKGEAAPAPPLATFSGQAQADAPLFVRDDGLVRTGRDIGAPALAAALVSVGGGGRAAARRPSGAADRAAAGERGFHHRAERGARRRGGGRGSGHAGGGRTGASARSASAADPWRRGGVGRTVRLHRRRSRLARGRGQGASGGPFARRSRPAEPPAARRARGGACPVAGRRTGSGSCRRGRRTARACRGTAQAGAGRNDA
ncbi:tRNA lysidine(34) synthetase TilS [Brevundimonas sp. SORGH_AS_0993]|uniref:tRNA lysidine(34) synthetase TilS n=1 Tax=Brevundimonas sp. SORGH_AS_0993 TaxID=3041794 RepID=UPI0027867190|nr:tRNA lysidine(34) synthetase TilS [Brevundimonas sp. SORGH_AS_0993]MDQ1154401.1 tRNA(Ile)-lysidine synthetase-like protein [Brevundimonas sp. SORGH_AS_0993]